MIDLHMHSYYSNDGEISPEELVNKYQLSGASLMSIADHNTVRAVEEAASAAKAAGVAYIPGIEIDCTYENTNFHMLGYGMNWNAPVFTEIEKNGRRQLLAGNLDRGNVRGIPHLAAESHLILNSLPTPIML